MEFHCVSFFGFCIAVFDKEEAALLTLMHLRISVVIHSRQQQAVGRDLKFKVCPKVGNLNKVLKSSDL